MYTNFDKVKVKNNITRQMWEDRGVIVPNSLSQFMEHTCGLVFEIIDINEYRPDDKKFVLYNDEYYSAFGNYLFLGEEYFELV